MFTNSLKIPDTTKKDFFELKLFEIDRKIWQDYCPAAFNSVLHPLTY